MSADKLNRKYIQKFALRRIKNKDAITYITKPYKLPTNLSRTEQSNIMQKYFVFAGTPYKELLDQKIRHLRIQKEKKRIVSLPRIIKKPKLSDKNSSEYFKLISPKRYELNEVSSFYSYCKSCQLKASPISFN